MTPEEARALEPSTTPGPWEVERFDGLGAPITNSVGPIMSACNCDGLYVEDADADLAAAAPDMRATIAALRWEYAARWPDGSFVNLEDPAASSEETFWTWNRKEVQDAAAELGCSLVRRPAGPVEVVEE